MQMLANRAAERMEFPLTSFGKTGVLRRKDGTPVNDTNPLMSPTRARGLFADMGEYARMLESDGTIRGWAHWLVTNLVDADWVVDPPTRATRDEKAAAKLVQKFFGLAEEWYEGGDDAMLRGGMKSLVLHAAQSFFYGFSAMEMKWSTQELDGKTYWVPDDIRWRAPWSVNAWLVDGDENLLGMEQVVQDEPGQTSGDSVDRSLDTSEAFVTIPIENLIIWINKGTDGNHEGESEMRAAWPWYQAKQDTVKRDLKSQTRLVDGMTIFKEMGNSEGVFVELSEADISAAIDLFAEWYEGNVPFLYAPFGIEMDHKWPAFEIPPPTERMEYYDKQIMLALGSMMIGIFAQQTGARDFNEVSKALADSMASMAGTLADTINGKPGLEWTGLVRKICDANFDTSGKFRYPTVRASKVSFYDLETVVSLLSRAAQFLLYTVSETDEYMFRGLVGLKKEPISVIKKRRLEAKTAGGQLSQEGSQSSQGPQESPISIRSDKKKDTKDAKDADKVQGKPKK